MFALVLLIELLHFRYSYSYYTNKYSIFFFGGGGDNQLELSYSFGNSDFKLFCSIAISRILKPHKSKHDFFHIYSDLYYTSNFGYFSDYSSSFS